MTGRGTAGDGGKAGATTSPARAEWCHRALIEGAERTATRAAASIRAGLHVRPADIAVIPASVAVVSPAQPLRDGRGDLDASPTASPRCTPSSTTPTATPAQDPALTAGVLRKLGGTIPLPGRPAR
jgi:hypothetical protein